MVARLKRDMSDDSIEPGIDDQLIGDFPRGARRSGEKPDDGSRWDIDGGYPWTTIADLVNVTGATVAERNKHVVVYRGRRGRRWLGHCRIYCPRRATRG